MVGSADEFDSESILVGSGISEGLSEIIRCTRISYHLIFEVPSRERERDTGLPTKIGLARHVDEWGWAGQLGARKYSPWPARES